VRLFPFALLLPKLGQAAARREGRADVKDKGAAKLRDGLIGQSPQTLQGAGRGSGASVSVLVLRLRHPGTGSAGLQRRNGGERQFGPGALNACPARQPSKPQTLNSSGPGRVARMQRPGCNPVHVGPRTECRPLILLRDCRACFQFGHRLAIGLGNRLFSQGENDQRGLPSLAKLRPALRRAPSASPAAFKSRPAPDSSPASGASCCASQAPARATRQLNTSRCEAGQGLFQLKGAGAHVRPSARGAIHELVHRKTAAMTSATAP